VIYINDHRFFSTVAARAQEFSAWETGTETLHDAAAGATRSISTDIDQDEDA
jgi:hypothetical protein